MMLRSYLTTRRPEKRQTILKERQKTLNTEPRASDTTSSMRDSVKIISGKSLPSTALCSSSVSRKSSRKRDVLAS
ncbi:unnamed protein product [Timema podura]|uniref:Uncharacterized protein n=1 Tax=Timema podura TaxID=61482 RepID=A0ABN7NWQ9_TIMPD|nr:unnamed protein product [Timema podura]